jgi:hypothetical protein
MSFSLFQSLTVEPCWFWDAKPCQNLKGLKNEECAKQAGARRVPPRKPLGISWFDTFPCRYDLNSTRPNIRHLDCIIFGYLPANSRKE